MICVADAFVTVLWHWDCLDLHVLFVLACAACIVWRPGVSALLACLWGATMWPAVASMRSDPGPPVADLRIGQDLATAYSILGKPAVDLARFGDARQLDRDMVGPFWFDEEQAAVMWRYGGYRVWVTHSAGSITGVSTRKYSDW